MADTKKYIWDFLMIKIGNEIAVAGIMGNMEAESGFVTTNMQDSYETDSLNDSNYTTLTDNGTYTNFIHDSIGYGLCQWTWHTRKKALLDLAKDNGKSVGDIDVQLSLLWLELTTDYKTSVLDRIKNETNIYNASTIVLCNFENPENQSQAVKNYRCKLSTDIYNTYNGSQITLEPPTIDTDVDTDNEDSETDENKKESLYQLIKKKGYVVETLTQSQSTILKALVIGNKCKVKHSYNKNKKIYGYDEYYHRIKIDESHYYRIKNVVKNGFIKLQYQKGIKIFVNPKYIKKE